jgi:hypothetical protein
MNDQMFRQIVFVVVSAGLVALSWKTQDATHLVGILTFLMKNPFSKAK